MENVIKACRICRSNQLEDFLDLGNQALTGVFPKAKSEVETYGKLILTKCIECDLVQLKHNFSMTEMYGDNYGYRSGLNESMVKHLKLSLAQILTYVQLNKGDLVIDIGSNDGTLLGFYPEALALKRLGVDPVGKKFQEFYREGVELIAEFFPSPQIQEKYGMQKAKVITSFSCFYDLPDPVQFAKDIEQRLETNGVWVFEQSYLPTMIETISYDTVCHEHLEYYSLKQIKFITDKANLKIVDVKFNNINGGSFCVIATPKNSQLAENTKLVEKILNDEEKLGLTGLEYYQKYAQVVSKHREELIQFMSNIKKQGKSIVALGASTKGNVVLQYCGLDTKYLDAVGEVNPFKYGKFTPGTKIPIVSEADIEKLNPEYKLILPWHFRDTFITREEKYRKSGGKLIFALPKIEVYPPESM